MWNACLYVFFGIYARYDEMDLGPNDEETVERISQSGGVGGGVVGQGVGLRAGQFTQKSF